MVYRTVQMHDGEIEVQSTPGPGRRSGCCCRRRDGIERHRRSRGSCASPCGRWLCRCSRCCRVHARAGEGDAGRCRALEMPAPPPRDRRADRSRSAAAGAARHRAGAQRAARPRPAPPAPRAPNRQSREPPKPEPPPVRAAEAAEEAAASRRRRCRRRRRRRKAKSSAGSARRCSARAPISTASTTARSTRDARTQYDTAKRFVAAGRRRDAHEESVSPKTSPKKPRRSPLSWPDDKASRNPDNQPPQRPAADMHRHAQASTSCE